MRNLTPQQLETLLSDVKIFLSITWDDKDTDRKLTQFIRSGIARLDAIAGVELDYQSTVFGNMGYVALCQLGRELLLERCFYANERALDDFESNHRDLLNSLYVQGKVYKNTRKGI